MIDDDDDDDDNDGSDSTVLYNMQSKNCCRPRKLSISRSIYKVLSVFFPWESVKVLRKSTRVH